MRQTPLIDFHRQAGGKLVEYAGWEMPLMYAGIIEEHHYTRQHASAFDVSHMGRVEFRGPDAEKFLQRLNTRNVGGMKPGLSRYSHMCRPDGGILDDVIVSRLEDHFLVVCNGANREKLLGWWAQQKAGFNVDVMDKTLETAMVAIQGPEAIATVAALLPFEIADLKRYHFKSGSFMGFQYFVARSGYTGEDGVEIILPARFAMTAATMLTSQSAERGTPIKPAGLGARDTLRLEAGMPLYGHELTEDWDSLTAGQAWACDLTKDFFGSDVLKRIAADGPKRKLVGMELAGRRIARQGAPILVGDQTVGVVTSGTQSPTLNKVIAMGLVDAAHANVGTELNVDLKNSQATATVVPLPFYKRKP